MLTSMSINLESHDSLKNNQHLGSLLHGVIIQQLDTDYAEQLHSNSLKPYSQYLYFDRSDQKLIWKISTITDESKSNLIDKLYNSFNGKIHIEHKNLALDINNKIISEPLSYKAISEEYYLTKPFQRRVVIKFLTPTSFKSNGDYTIFPEVHNIYNSLLNKWNSFATDISLKDDDILNHMVDHTKIIGYNLRSTKFDLEGVRINSFKGEICLLISGPESLVRIANLLFAFGEYSGVGVKCALGMGGIKVL